MDTDMLRRALATRDAYLALLELKAFVDEAARTTHDVELEAVHVAISAEPTGDIASRMKALLDRLGSTDFEESLKRARQSLIMATS